MLVLIGSAVVLAWIVLALLGQWVAVQKGRRPGEGLVLGLLFGPLGVLVEAQLPTGPEGGGGIGRR